MFCTFAPLRNFHAMREEILSAGNPVRSKITQRGITMGRGPIWGINSLSFILSFSYLFHGSSKITLTPVKINPFIYLKKFLLMFLINTCSYSCELRHFPYHYKPQFYNKTMLKTSFCVQPTVTCFAFSDNYVKLTVLVKMINSTGLFTVPQSRDLKQRRPRRQ